MARSRPKHRRYGRAVPAIAPAVARQSPAWPRRRALVLLIVAAAVAAVVTISLLDRGDPAGDRVLAGGAGLPATPDYHSLLVDPADPAHVLLGTHVGIYASRDGGRSWAFAQLDGRDAMNLARGGAGDVLWVAGHNVLARSSDGGVSWADVEPTGLPSLDVHGFAVDPTDPDRLFAAIAGEGMFVSDDAGASFVRVSEEVGGAVFGLAASPDGTLFAADPTSGLFVSADTGERWRLALRGGILGVALNPAEPRVMLATGPGIMRSSDAGRTWRTTLALDEALAGPVAWSASDPDVAYAVVFAAPGLLNRLDEDGPAPGRLYRTVDGGMSWTLVDREEQ